MTHTEPAAEAEVMHIVGTHYNLLVRDPLNWMLNDSETVCSLECTWHSVPNRNLKGLPKAAQEIALQLIVLLCCM